MDIQRIRDLADRIERTPHHSMDTRFNNNGPLIHFNMGFWHCGSVGCIGGWAVHLYLKENEAHGADAPETVGCLLDIDHARANKLCYPSLPDHVRYDDVTPEQAAQVLRNLADTGEVDWSIISKVPA